MRVLIFGGTGSFGARLCEVLDQDAGLELLISSRCLEKAGKFVSSLNGASRKAPVKAEISGIESVLAQHKPHLIVHCAGPFQNQDYRVAQAAINAGVNYLDLSDGRRFVERFPELDASAKRAGVFAVTACSTTSALSTAAAIELSQPFSQVHAVRVGVTPGNRAPRGRAVVEAILSYMGEPIPVLRDGERESTAGWGTLQRETLPGLPPRWFSPCDAPDMVVMPKLFPSLKEFRFLAGLELSVLHLPLWGLAQMRRRRLVPNLARASTLFLHIAKLLEPFGTDKGGMFVELSGRDHEGEKRTRLWTLLASGGDGPYIPVLGIAALIKRLIRGGAVPPGARIAAGEISLEEFDREFSEFNITTRIEDF